MISQQRLQELLAYNEETGVFTWRARSSNNSRAVIGEVAGYIDPTPVTGGYRNITVDGEEYRAHRLAWLYKHGVMPESIDHLDGVRDNNRISNLRPASSLENARNQARRRDNSSGRTGVSFRSDSKRWRARIRVNDSLINLGTFAEYAAACTAREHAERKYGFHQNHGREPVAAYS